MTPQSLSTEDQELSRALAGLTEALAHSERRYSHLARIVRWGTLGIISTFAFAGYLVANQVGIVHAQIEGDFPKASSAVEALNNINANLMVLGEMGRTLNRFMPAVKGAIMENEDVQRSLAEYFEENPGALTPAGGQPLSADEMEQKKEDLAMKAIVGSFVGTFVDVVVVMQRFRKDSDAFQDFITGPEDVLHGVETQLVDMNKAMKSIPIMAEEMKLMNVAMPSIPAMAVQMDLMNRNMSSMTYSVGSTMGRVGNWMPW